MVGSYSAISDTGFVLIEVLKDIGLSTKLNISILTNLLIVVKFN